MQSLVKSSFLVAILFLLTYGQNDYLSESDLMDFFANKYNNDCTQWCIKIQYAAFDHEIDLENQKKNRELLNVTLQSAAYSKSVWEKYFKNISPDDYENPDLKRQIKFAKNIGRAALDSKDLTEFTKITDYMLEVYSKGKICPYENSNCNLTLQGIELDPDILHILSTTTDYKKLTYIWKAWRHQTGAKMLNPFQRYVELSNKAAQLNGFRDTSEEWMENYEIPHMQRELDLIWSQVKPLYLALHKYVTRKLKDIYGNDLDISDGLLPANVFGGMWGEDWTAIRKLVRPFPDVQQVNVTQSMIHKGYTVRTMFEEANRFYMSLGLDSNAKSYDTYDGAMIEKPIDGRKAVCHASAWDMCDRKHFRIKMCTSINSKDLYTVHHEMGHIAYFTLYKNQPLIYRDGANPGFHEAIGDTIALSVISPKHLYKIGLINTNEDNYESSINALMDTALIKVAFLPYSLLLDKWRWDVFQGNVKPQHWNDHYWRYRKQYQLLKPPVGRNEFDFDPASKFHIAADAQYIAYFVSNILQFQFFKSLCIAAKEYDPSNKQNKLHKCDFYGHKEAGDKLRAGLSLGSSKHWSEAMNAITGHKTMDASALLEYFEPLYRFLLEDNKKHEADGMGDNEKENEFDFNF